MHCGEATDLLMYLFKFCTFEWCQRLKMIGSVSKTSKFYSSISGLVYVFGSHRSTKSHVINRWQSGFEWFWVELLRNWTQMLSINVIVTIEDCWQPIIDQRCSLSSTPSAHDNRSRAQESCKTCSVIWQKWYKQLRNILR